MREDSPSGLASAHLASSAWLAQPTLVAGADFSHLAFFESRGVVYRDGGQVGTAGILKDTA